MKKELTEAQIEKQMERAIKKIPFEMKKIKFILGVVKTFKKIKSIVKEI